MDGTDLKERRAAAGWSQMKLATELGVHVMTVSRWERNVDAISPKMEKLIRFTLPQGTPEAQPEPETTQKGR